MMARSFPVDRWAGLFFVALGLALYGLIIPWQVETVGYGWLRPRTLPRILASVIVLAGLALLWRPAGDARPGHVPWTRSALFAVILIVSLLLMAHLGFVYVAPAMALAIMLLAGERRPLWLGFGSAGLPLAIWFCVAVVLGRPLP